MRAAPGLTSLDIAILGDATGGDLPRARLICEDDERIYDLDGEANIRKQRIRIDVFEQKGQVARSWADTIETALASLKDTTTGGWNFADVELEGTTDGPPQVSPSGSDEPVNMVSIGVMLVGVKT